jgi:hypothetical protein
VTELSGSSENLYSLDVSYTITLSPERRLDLALLPLREEKTNRAPANAQKPRKTIQSNLVMTPLSDYLVGSGVYHAEMYRVIRLLPSPK